MKTNKANRPPRNKAPLSIVVKSHPVAVRALRPGQLKRVEVVWSATLVGGPHAGVAVEGHPEPREAVGALIRALANACDTADQVCDLFASLLCSNPTLTPDVKLARAVMFASEHRLRRHPGVTVCIHSLNPTPTSAAVAPTQGGAA